MIALAISCRGDFEIYGPPSSEEAVAVVSAEPAVVSALGGEEVSLYGSGLDGVRAVRIGEDAGEVLDTDDGSIRLRMPRTLAGTPLITLSFEDADDVLVEGPMLEVLPLPLAFRAWPEPPYVVPAGGAATAAAAGDFDGDGATDVVVAGETGDVAALLLNRAGVLVDALPGDPSRFVAPDAVSSITVADLNGDGSLDLVVTRIAPNAPRIFLNDGAARFVAGPDLPIELVDAPRAVAADFDRDGLPDLAFSDAAEGTPAVHVLWNRTTPGGTVVFTALDPATLANTGSISSDVVATDVDGDGALDLLLLHARAEHADGRPYTLLRNDGRGAFLVDETAVPSLEGPGPRRGAVLDCHGDGDWDVYLGGNAQDRLLENSFGQLRDMTPEALPVDDARVGAVAAADLDLDGLWDIVVANLGAQNRLYASAADGRVRDVTPVLPIERTDTVAVLLLDVDQDGADDILFVEREGPASLLLWSAAP